MINYYELETYIVCGCDTYLLYNIITKRIYRDFDRPQLDFLMCQFSCWTTIKTRLTLKLVYLVLRDNHKSVTDIVIIIYVYIGIHIYSKHSFINSVRFFFFLKHHCRSVNIFLFQNRLNFNCSNSLKSISLYNSGTFNRNIRNSVYHN